MQTRAFFALALLLAAGCGQAGDTQDSVTAPESLGINRSEFGVKPPPPLGSEETSIFIGVDGDGTSSERQSGPSAESAAAVPEFSATLRGRYFANTPNQNAWIQFETLGNVIASPGARLQYNEKTGKTTGNGTLTDGNRVVIDLRLVQIDAGSVFGVCGSAEGGSCAHFSFIYDGTRDGGGSVSPVGLD